MLYCPKCKAEYRDGFTKCSDCDEILVENIETSAVKPADNEPITHYIDEIIDETLLIIIADQVEYSYITSMLAQENIAYIVKVDGISQYLKMFTGISFSGREIFVGKADIIRATEIIESAKLELPLEYEDY